MAVSRGSRLAGRGRTHEASEGEGDRVEPGHARPSTRHGRPITPAPSPLTRHDLSRCSRASVTTAIGDSRLAERLRRNIAGEVLFDRADRGRYATDASIYQIEPLGVIVPRTIDDVAAALAIAREEGIPVLPRGGGTSQCGQTVNRALVDRLLEASAQHPACRCRCAALQRSSPASCSAN